METHSSNNISWTERQLFGGAITCDIPSNWRDVSDLRQVPDHQEVYQDVSSSQDRCVIIEILDHGNEIEGDLASFFFEDLCESNSSSESDFSLFDEDLIYNPPPDSTISSGIGIQKVSQGPDTDHAGNPRELNFEFVNIELCVVRLHRVHADLLITLSSKLSDRSEAQSGFSDEFRRIIGSFTIRNFALFGEEEE